MQEIGYFFICEAIPHIMGTLHPWALCCTLIPHSEISEMSPMRTTDLQVFTGWVMGIKEGTYSDEHWVLYVSDKSLNSTPETIIILYVN